MTDPQESGGEEALNIESDMDMPERPGWCAYMGGYVRDGEMVSYFGEEYICRAPNLVRAQNSS